MTITRTIIETAAGFSVVQHTPGISDKPIVRGTFITRTDAELFVAALGTGWSARAMAEMPGRLREMKPIVDAARALNNALTAAETADALLDRARTAPLEPSPVRVTHLPDGGVMENIG